MHFFYLFFILIFTFSSNANTLKVVSDIWCPYICEDYKNPGYIVELIRDIFAQNNINIKFEIVPLARAIKLTKNNKVDMVLALTDEHIIKNELNKNNISIGSFANDFFVAEGNRWRYISENDLSLFLSEGNKLGIIKGYEYGKYIHMLQKEKPEYFHMSHGESPLLMNIDMLNKKRINILLDTKNTVIFKMKNETNKLIYAGTQGDNIPLYIGFSESISPKYKLLLDEGITHFRKSGKLAVILNKYGISDWETQ